MPYSNFRYSCITIYNEAMFSVGYEAEKQQYRVHNATAQPEAQ